MNEWESDQARGLLVSSTMDRHFAKIQSVYVGETGERRSHRKCASRTIFRAGSRHITSDLLRRHKKHIPLCYIRRASGSFRLCSQHP